MTAPRPTVPLAAFEAAEQAAYNCPCHVDGPGLSNCCLGAAVNAAAPHIEARSGLGPVYLPWTYWDGTVETEIRATAYPYGGGQPGTGVQLTLESRHNGVTVAIRLPRDSAHRLAKAILAGEEDRNTPAARLASLHAQPHTPTPRCSDTCHCQEQP